MKNLNPYQETVFSERFKHTHTYKQLCKDFDLVSFAKFYQQEKDYQVTPRQYIGDKNRQTMFCASSFYFLEFLLEKSPKEIYDLGCGWNIFKRYIPNIIGVGAESPESLQYYADVHDFVDDDFVQGHQSYFESVFSICALHFHPLTDFGKIVGNFYSMIKPGGRGFLSLNVQRMLEKTKHGMLGTSSAEYDNYCRMQLQKLDYIKFLAIDIDFEYIDEGVDGNIKIVIERTQ